MKLKNLLLLAIGSIASVTFAGEKVFEGIIPDGPTKAGPWSRVIRVFKRPDGVVIFLNEWDFVVDGGAVVVPKEIVNTHVGTAPGRLIIKKSSAGRILSEVTWATSRKFYTLTVMDNSADASAQSTYHQDWLLKIASNIH